MAPTKNAAAKKAAAAPKPAPAAEAPAPEAPAAPAPVVEDAPAPEAPADEPAPAPEAPEADAPAAEEDAKDEDAADAPADGPDASLTPLSSPAAPLEAPAPPKVTEPEVHEDPDAPQPAGNLGAALVKNAVPGSRLIDNATGQTPDPDTIFAELDGPGVLVQCTIRLLQETWVGPHEAPITQLVMPQTQITGPEKAAQIIAAVRDQIERENAAAEAEVEVDAAE